MLQNRDLIYMVKTNPHSFVYLTRGSLSFHPPMFLGVKLVLLLLSGSAHSLEFSVTDDYCCVRTSTLSVGSIAAHICLIQTFYGDPPVVSCWGTNAYGQLGIGSTSDPTYASGTSFSPVQLPTGFVANEIATGTDSTCALSRDSRVVCWGDGSFGQRGIGSTWSAGGAPGEMGDSLVTMSLPVGSLAVAIRSGPYHVCIVTRGGTVACWGWNGDGQVGIGSSDWAIGDTPNQVGSGLQFARLPSGFSAIAVACGLDFTCALSCPSTVLCWGSNIMGQLGVMSAVSQIGKLPADMPSLLKPVALPDNSSVLSLSCGTRHACVLHVNGQVACWGDNTYGQLGIGSTTGVGRAPTDHIVAVSFPPGLSAIALSCGDYHVCVRFSSGSVGCWGRNDGGQLGVGSVQNVGDGPGEMGAAMQLAQLPTGRHAVNLTCSQGRTCVVLDDMAIVCWGAGFEYNTVIGDQPGEMGDALTQMQLSDPVGTRVFSGEIICIACAMGLSLDSSLSRGPCHTPCLAGYYRGGTCPEQCCACPMGTYNTATGSTRVSECVACPPGTFGAESGNAVGPLY